VELRHVYAFFPCANIAAIAAPTTTTIRYTVSGSSISVEVLNASIVAVGMDVLSDCPRNLISPRNDDAEVNASLGIFRIICVMFGEAKNAKPVPSKISDAIRNSTTYMT